MTSEAIVAAVADMEAAYVPQRSKGAIRQARYMERQKASLVTQNDDNDAKEKSPRPPKEKHPPITPKGVSPRRLPDDFVMPDDWKQWARETRGWPPPDLETEAANFVDYWQARGSGAAKRDWRKTWQTWVRNSKRPDGSFRNVAEVPFDKTEYQARLAKIGRTESTGPPQPIGNVAKQIIGSVSV